MFSRHFSAPHLHFSVFLGLENRNGKGVENIGNMLGNSFICPIGNKHFGIGFCTYSGEFCRGLFHGDGEILCMSGQYYRGKWKQGKKHGEVRDFFLSMPQYCFDDDFFEYRYLIGRAIFYSQWRNRRR